MLNTLIHAAENNLAAWIKQHTSPDFDCIYNDTTVRLKPVIKDSKILTYKTIISEISTRRI
mgnify:CR=1 FL=1